MRQVLLWLTGLILMLAVAACGSGGGSSPVTASHVGQTYRDSAGWTVEVPRGWHVLRFSDAKDGITSAGVQLSTVKLPQPSLAPGFPIQVNDGVLPGRGVGLIIATDTDRAVRHYGRLAVPPLPAFDDPNGWRYWNAGSSAGAGPDIEILWFRVHGRTFIACAKIGAKATKVQT
jgi:hypothetical protein